MVAARLLCHTTRAALPFSCNKSLTVYSALSSSSTRRSIRAAALYLGIQQHMQAPELTNPARMPDCLGSSKVSKALAAALNTKYAGQLQMNASVDTTYIQVSCLGCGHRSSTTSISRILEHSAVHRRQQGLDFSHSSCTASEAGAGCQGT